jgi:uncharacterized protein
VIAVDTGLFVALADRSDDWHESAQRALGTIEEGWVTTWPVLAEACHLMRRRIGANAVFDLMDVVRDGGVDVWSPSPAEAANLPALMRRYANLPMDLADASLVLLAEHLGHGRILSTDRRDFGAYRWKNRKPFKNLLEAPR